MRIDLNLAMAIIGCIGLVVVGWKLNDEYRDYISGREGGGGE